MVYKFTKEGKDIIKNEGRYEAFDKGEYKLRIIRQDLGHRCGYVGVNKENAFYGMNYNYRGSDSKPTQKEEYINDIKVHGGLTYSRGYLEKQPDKNIRWFGFDTAHSGDASLREDGFFSEQCLYRDKEYIKNECIALMEQLDSFNPNRY